MTKLLIVEDAEMTARGSADLFRQDGFDVAHCRSQTTAIILYHAFQPDAAVIDSMIPEFEEGQAVHDSIDKERGFALAHTLKKIRPKLGIVMISAHIDLERPYRLLLDTWKIGVGFIGKYNHEQCRNAVLEVMQGKNPVYEALRYRVTQEEQFLKDLIPQARIVVQTAYARLNTQADKLTAAEWEIAQTAKFGLTAEGIAGQIEKEPDNVRKRLQNIYEKLGITRAQLREKHLEPTTVLRWVMILHDIRTRNT